MSRRKLIAGNWKMNGLRGDSARLVSALLAKGRIDADILLCPSATMLDEVGKMLRGSPFMLGGQDCHGAPSGAFTGDISAAQLKDVGCSHVIVGHSERRGGHGEADGLVAAKAQAALAAGLCPIVCVGENEAQRQSGDALAVVGRQLTGSMPPGAKGSQFVVAYEPVWAIGTGRTPTPAEVQEVHAHLRKILTDRIGEGAHKTRILYGGSVKPANAGELMTLPDVDGGLIGGASLDAEAFWAIALASLTVNA